MAINLICFTFNRQCRYKYTTANIEPVSLHCLIPEQVKIWFQNRRTKLKRTVEREAKEHEQMQRDMATLAMQFYAPPPPTATQQWLPEDLWLFVWSPHSLTDRIEIENCVRSWETTRVRSRVASNHWSGIYGQITSSTIHSSSMQLILSLSLETDVRR